MDRLYCDECASLAATIEQGGQSIHASPKVLSFEEQSSLQFMLQANDQRTRKAADIAVEILANQGRERIEVQNVLNNGGPYCDVLTSYVDDSGDKKNRVMTLLVDQAA